jgi:Spy/CpxP family protein refolding chaperone
MRKFGKPVSLPFVLLSILFALPAEARDPAPSPYAGLEHREVKALSPEQVSDYLAGNGMGLALPAELNGYPGPKHVLELADRLRLTAEQRAGTEEAWREMNEEAVRLGRQIVDGEAELDRLFASGGVERGALAAKVDALAALQGRLRLAHLAAHLRMKALLTSEQVAAYQQARGYAEGHGGHLQHHPHHHGGGGGAAPAEPEAGAFWSALRELCGKAYEGRLVEGTEPSDAAIGEQRLVMHVRSCSDDEVRIPFHVGDDRSRTWVITPIAGGVRLKHDHRHEDGSEDEVTQYGGDTREISDPLSLDFHADAFTAELIPAAATNVWTVAIQPGESFTYALRREASDRRFRVRFDLTKPVAPPPAPW